MSIENISKRENNENWPRQKSHWEKYKIYYLVFSSFFLTLLIILISNSNINSEIRKISYKLEESGNFSPSERDDSPNKPPLNPSDDVFTIPNPKKQNKNWIDETISQESVRDEVKIWISNFKYLPQYQTNESLEIDKHVLLYGPPGSGKSFLAQKFVENESAAFFKAKFETEIYVGSSVRKQTEAFNRAKELLRKEEIKATRENRKSRPVVIIMDELDSFGMKDESGHNSYTLQEVNGILRMFDEVHEKKLNIIFIGITNYPHLLNEALIRVGRLGRQIKIDYPEGEEIEKLINYLEKLLKDGYKYSANENKWEKDKNSKDMVIEWPNNFWSDVCQHTKELREKYKEDGVGFSLRDLQSAVSDCLSLKGGENVQKIIPDSSDYKKRLEKFMVDKKRHQEEKRKNLWRKLPKPIPIPE